MYIFRGPYDIFKKNLDLFFASKVAWPQTFCSQYCLAAQTSPELLFYIRNISQDSSVSFSVPEAYLSVRHKKSCG